MGAVRHGHHLRAHTTPLYRMWARIIQVCTNPNHPKYNIYGGRGISVCERWLTFENFRDDIGEHPGKGWSIDRWPNNDGHYEPTNWRWARPWDQAQNRRSTKLTWDDVKELRQRYRPGLARSLQTEFGLSTGGFWKIINGSRWTNAQQQR